jgi:hypothetical protein
MLDSHLLLTLAAMMIECVQQRREAPGELVRLVQVLPPPLEGLFANHGAAVALHGRTEARDKLDGHHAFKLVLSPAANQTRQSPLILLVLCFGIGVLQPKGGQRVHRDALIPIISI